VLRPFSKNTEAAGQTSTAIVAFLEGIALFSIILDSKRFDFDQILKSVQNKIIEYI